MNVSYKRSYYSAMGADVPRSADQIVPLVLEFVSPTSVVDIGCGTGAWLAEFQRHGVQDIMGLDGPWVDSELLQIPAGQFRVVDLSRPVAEGRRFDLVVCLEVAEHLRAEHA